MASVLSGRRLAASNYFSSAVSLAVFGKAWQNQSHPTRFGRRRHSQLFYFYPAPAHLRAQFPTHLLNISCLISLPADGQAPRARPSEEPSYNHKVATQRTSSRYPMSAESFAALRKSAGNDLADLAEEHFKHDLHDSDRQALIAAGRSISTSAMIGSAVGLGLGLYLAFRLRKQRTQYFNAFRAMEKPTSVVFANGRTEKIPDITPFLKPTTLGDVAAYLFFAGGGLFFGGELGLLIGGWSATRTIRANPESRKRIETAFRRFKADALRKQADDLDKGTDAGISMLGV